MTVRGRPILEKLSTTVFLSWSEALSDWEMIRLFSTSSQQPVVLQMNSGVLRFWSLSFKDRSRKSGSYAETSAE
jgi:hypothetical protein